MHPLIRLKQTKNISSKKTFSAINGLRIVASNIRDIFTRRLVSGGNAWHITEEETITLQDYSLIFENGEPKFVKTPASSEGAVLEISQDI